MKTNFTILFFFIFCNITFSQNEKETKHTISANLNYILDQWISKSSEASFFSAEPDHTIIAMYKFQHQGVDWRFGVAGLNKKESNLNGLVGAIFNKSYKFYTFSAGIQKTKNVWKKWGFTYGGDLIFQYQNLKVETEDNIFFGEDTSKIKRESVGLNGFTGIQYNLNNHISFSTELSFILKRTSKSIDGDIQLFRLEDITAPVEREETIIEANLIAPIALFLNFHF